MYFIWTLASAPVVAYLYGAFADTRRGRSTAFCAPLPGARHTSLESSSYPRRRPVSRITRAELPALIAESEDVIFIDLRAEQNTDDPPLTGFHVLPTSADQLQDLLPWLPPETSVVLYGDSKASKALLSGLRTSAGSAAIYFLAEDHSAVARRLCFLVTLVGFAFAVAPAHAQSSSSAEIAPILSYGTQNSSQSNGGYDSKYKQYQQYSETAFHHLAIEAGAGFDIPVGNTRSSETFGYNVKFGGGYNFSRRFGVLAEYEFNRLGIPNSFVTATVGSQSSQQSTLPPQGNVHVWGLTLDPIYYYKTTGAWGGYVTGGGGFYRKVTSFTQPVDLGTVFGYYGSYEQFGSQLISHFSSNQGGLNIGTGLTHNIGTGGAKVFAEARYVWVNSPRASATQTGSGKVRLVPITFGIRF